MQNLTFVLILVILTNCTSSQEGYVINGKVSEFPDGTLIYLSDRDGIFDSTKVNNNKFIFSGKLNEEFKEALIHTKDFKHSKIIWLVNNSLIFEANNSFKEAKLSGSEIQEQFEAWFNNVEIWDDKADSVRDILRELNDDTKKASLNKLMQSYRDKQFKEELNFVKSQPDYHFSAFVLNSMKNRISKDDVKNLYNNLNEDVKNNEWGKVIAYFLENSVELEIGDPAVDFSLPNLSGENVSLNSFKGKYVLLEFTAKWCRPCRQENPNLLKAYKNYRDKGFDILAVSLDNNKKNWMAFVEEDSIIWPTVSDLKAFESEVALTYSVNYIPKNYLLDRKGIVIAKDLRGDNLQIKLKEIFE